MSKIVWTPDSGWTNDGPEAEVGVDEKGRFVATPKSVRYAWIITKDHIADESAPKGTYQNAVGVTGPRTATDEEIKLARKGLVFRLLDDDAELYYEGRIWIEDAETPTAEHRSDWARTLAGKLYEYLTWGPCRDEVAAFGPLNDFGLPNAGAVHIQYRCADPANPNKRVWAGL